MSQPEKAPAFRRGEHVTKGRMTTGEEKRIDARADRKLGKKGKRK